MPNQARVLESNLIQYAKTKNGGMRKVLVGKITKAISETLLGVVLFYNKLNEVLVNIRQM